MLKLVTIKSIDAQSSVLCIDCNGSKNATSDAKISLIRSLTENELDDSST